jgi:Flp pilus assembly protein TadD
MATPQRPSPALIRILDKAMQDHRAGRLAEAELGYRQALQLDPDNPDALHLLGILAGAMGDHAKAAELVGRSLRRKQTSDAYLHLGVAHAALGRIPEAVKNLRTTIRLDPRNALAHHHLGNAYSQIGRREEARAAYRAAIGLKPDLAEAYSNLGLIATWREGDPEARALLALGERVDTLPAAARIHVHYALGKYHDDTGDPDRAFAHWREGAGLKRRTVSFDADANDRAMAQIAASFPSGPWSSMKTQGDPSDLPIFVLGMPRSGTSLVEQILASHPEVHGAGEVGFLRAALAGLQIRPDLLQAATLESGPLAEELRRRGAGYVARLSSLAPKARRITDKLPNNFQLIGAIQLALPNAAIVFCRRDLRDVCLSCYQTLFMHGHAWSYDLLELARYALAFERLMAHWKEVLPGRILELDYETLVTRPEEQARRLIAHCGLGWDDRCLEFHKSARAVRTASLGQVRQPINRASVGRWRRYESQLATLLVLLARGSEDEQSLAIADDLS